MKKMTVSLKSIGVYSGQTFREFHFTAVEIPQEHCCLPLCEHKTHLQKISGNQ